MNVDLLPKRFRDKYIPEPMSGCWIWVGAYNSCGYGSFYSRAKKHCVGAHRFCFELLKGKVPSGLTLDHLCRNRACVNPNHLEPVTHAENMRRSPIMGAYFRLQRFKTHCVNGHRFTDENTHIDSTGARKCRSCDKIRHRRYRAAKRAQR